MNSAENPPTVDCGMIATKPSRKHLASEKWPRCLASLVRLTVLPGSSDPGGRGGDIATEGGDPSTSRKSPGRTKYEPITLERGATHDPAFEQWANQVWTQGAGADAEASLKDFRKDIVIEIHDDAGQLVVAYKVLRCWVSEFQRCPTSTSMTAAWCSSISNWRTKAGHATRRRSSQWSRWGRGLAVEGVDIRDVSVDRLAGRSGPSASIPGPWHHGPAPVSGRCAVALRLGSGRLGDAEQAVPGKEQLLSVVRRFSCPGRQQSGWAKSAAHAAGAPLRRKRGWRRRALSLCRTAALRLHLRRHPTGL